MTRAPNEPIATGPWGRGSLALRARCVFPVTGPPLSPGVVVVTEGRIEAVGRRALAPRRTVDLGNVALLPGLVNAHAHLDLSDCREPIGQPGQTLPEWIAQVVAHRRAVVQRASESPRDRDKSVALATSAEVVSRGARESARGGVAFVGDVRTADVADLEGESPARIVFREVLGLQPARAEETWQAAERFVASHTKGFAGRGVGLSPHAPYSTRWDLVERAVRYAAQAACPVMMHLAESREELELLRTGGGPFRAWLEQAGAWAEGAVPHGTRVLDYLRLLAGAPRVVVVHGNFLEPDEAAWLAAERARAGVVYCPRTHAYFGHPRYPLTERLAAGVRVALGTDSRASNPDLALWRELRYVAARYPELSPAEVLRLGTLAGAEVLGMADWFGSLEPGKRAALAVASLDEYQGGDPHRLLLRARRVTGLTRAAPWGAARCER